jgi:GNAT superfamily N-acetyltransferase
MEPAFRLAIESDLPLLLKLVQEFHEYDGHPFDEEVVTRALRELIRNPAAGRIWIIGDEEGVSVGYAVLGFGYSIEFHGRDAFIDELFLQREYRGRGWGKLAMEFIAEAARSLGISALHLEVTRGNTRALHLYKASGFQDHDRFLMTKWIHQR